MTFDGTRSSFDATTFARAVIALLPEARTWLVSALMLGGGFDGFAAAFRPVVEWLFGGHIDLAAMTFTRWFFLAGLLVAPFYWVSRFLANRRPEGKRRRAVAIYADLLEEASVRLTVPKAAANRAKERFLNQLADVLSSGGTIPLAKGLEELAK